MSINNEEIYDHILGSGCLTYPWYSDVIVEQVPLGDAHWAIIVYGEDPDDSDEVVSVHLTPTMVLDICERIKDDVYDNKYGTSYIYGVTPETRRECGNLLIAACEDADDDTDFDAASADQLLQVLLYGEVIFG